MGAMSRWVPTGVGLAEMRSAISDERDVVAYGTDLLSKVRRRWFFETRDSSYVRRIVQAVRPRLAHSHFASDAALISPIIRKLQLPHIVTVHGHDVTALGGVASREIRRRIDVLQRADVVLAVSEYIADRTADLAGPNCRIQVHRIGVPIGPAPPTRPQNVDAVFVGRLTDQKGIIDALRALGITQRALGRPVRFLVVGDGPLRGAAEVEAARLGVCTEFLGRVSPAAIPGTLASARVFLGPSKTGSNGAQEGFGMVFLEAALARVPVVSCRSGGVGEAVVDGVTGLLARPGDVMGIAERLTVLLESPSIREQMGTKGRERVIDKFDVARQTEGLEEIYESCFST